MKYCNECGRAIKDDIVTSCPECNAPIKTNMDTNDIKKLTQVAHKRERQGYDMSQNAYCFLVVGGILFIIGVIFFYLSFKNTGSSSLGNSSMQLSITCFEFWVFVAGVAFGAASIIYGFIKAIIAHNIRKKYLTLIDEIRANKFIQ